MKYGELITIYPAIQEIARKQLPFEKARRIYRMRKALESEYAFYAEEERKLVNAYAARDADGNPEISPEGRVRMTSPHDAAEYQRAIAAIKEMDCAVQITPITISAAELGNQPITAESMAALESVVKWEDADAD